ncbi:hypothetical protein GCM10027048_34770 [Hymenobacter coalescens]
MPDYIFSAEQLRPLPVHFRYMRRSAVTQVAELGAGVRFSDSRQHQSGHYRQQELYKPVSDLDYALLLSYEAPAAEPVRPAPAPAGPALRS